MAATPRAARAVLYTRVSTDEQADKGTSLADQLIACRQKADALGAVVTAHYEDAGVSGGLYLGRPSFQSALRDIDEGRANMLIIANMSRYSRDREHQSAVKKRVEAAGGRLVFCDMTFDDTPEGDLAFGIMGTFADYERKAIRSRTTKGLRRRAEQGCQPCRARSPFGYHIVSKADVLRGLHPAGTDGTYAVVEEEARWVREVFRRYAGGESLRSVAKWLQDSGVAPRYGGEFWRFTTVRKILGNSVYKGEATYGMRERKHDESLLSQGYTRPYTVHQRQDGEWITIAVPPLVDEGTWDACQQRIREGRETRSGNPTRKFLLTGLLRCPVCRNGMNGRHRERIRKKGTVYREHYYHCRHFSPAYDHWGRVCNAAKYDAGTAEAVVLNAVREVARRPELVGAAIAAYGGGGTPMGAGAGTLELEAELRACQAEERATVEAQIAGIQAGVDAAIYAERLRALASRRAGVQGRLDAARAQAEPGASLPLRVPDTLARALRDVDEALDAPELTTAERHNLLAQVILDVYPEGDAEYRVRLQPFGGIGETVPNISALG